MQLTRSGTNALCIMVLTFLLTPSLSQQPDNSPAPVVSPSLVTSNTAITFSTAKQIEEDFQNIACKNKERLAAVRKLFLKMGAAESDLLIEKKGGAENLVIRKSGTTGKGRLVIGAHYDKAASGCGAVDNWSGVVTVAHLYKTLKDIPFQKDIFFVAFAREEEGLIGSRAMAKGIPKEEVTEYCAMINIDSTGMGAPQVLSNISSPALGRLAELLAGQMELPFGKAELAFASGDSASFLEKKIPAVTLHGLAGNFDSIIHTGKDQAEQIKPERVYLCYRLALAMLITTDRNPCDAYR